MAWWSSRLKWLQNGASIWQPFRTSADLVLDTKPSWFGFIHLAVWFQINVQLAQVYNTHINSIQLRWPAVDLHAYWWGAFFQWSIEIGSVFPETQVHFQRPLNNWMCNYYHRSGAKHAFEYCMNKRFIFSTHTRFVNPVKMRISSLLKYFISLYYTAQIEICEPTN